MRRPSRSAMLVRPIFLAALTVVLPAFAGATSYTITTFVDDAVDDGNCTLREAIRASDTNLGVDACAGGGAVDSITLPTGTYPFAGDEALFNGGSLTIQSATLNPFNVSIDLLDTGRFLGLHVSGNYVLGGLAIVNGQAPVGGGFGAAILATEVDLRIFNFRFLSNDAAGTEGGGGALDYYSSVAGANLALANGAFLSNSATSSVLDSGGGAARVSVSNGATAAIRDVTFIGNVATASSASARGGALYLESTEVGSVANCNRCVFQNNTVVAPVATGLGDAAGGAVFAEANNGGRIGLVDGRFTGNSASGAATSRKTTVLHGGTDSGGSLFLERLFIDFNGGPLDSFTRDVSLVSFDGANMMSILDSQLTFGSAGGLEVFSNSAVQLGHLTIADYPLEGARLTSGGQGQILLQNSVVSFNGTDLTTVGNIFQTTNFVGGDPLFLDEVNGDYHLSELSPAINAGTSSAVTMRLADLDHRGRRAGPATDIGCYEVNGLFAHGFENGDLIDWSSIMP